MKKKNPPTKGGRGGVVLPRQGGGAKNGAGPGGGVREPLNRGGGHAFPGSPGIEHR